MNIAQNFPPPAGASGGACGELAKMEHFCTDFELTIDLLFVIVNLALRARTELWTTYGAFFIGACPSMVLLRVLPAQVEVLVRETRRGIRRAFAEARLRNGAKTSRACGQ